MITSRGISCQYMSVRSCMLLQAVIGEHPYLLLNATSLRHAVLQHAAMLTNSMFKMLVCLQSKLELRRVPKFLTLNSRKCIWYSKHPGRCSNLPRCSKPNELSAVQYLGCQMQPQLQLHWSHNLQLPAHTNMLALKPPEVEKPMSRQHRSL